MGLLRKCGSASVVSDGFPLDLNISCVVALQYDPNWQELVTTVAAATTTAAPATTTTAPATTTLDTKELGGDNDGNAVNLEACFGECDNHDQCAEGLYCFQRENGEPIPGCHGSGSGDNWDYCVSAIYHAI